MGDLNLAKAISNLIMSTGLVNLSLQQIIMFFIAC